ncbi:hypothetical protein [Actinoplanes sp. G11-F43]|uniref:hypothetical protein n=1 Tax=Actinoplanes sp. G11-F43 TaxID=3424130 RepID=UPI003D3337B5
MITGLGCRDWEDVIVADFDGLLPRQRTPLDYLNLVDDPRLDRHGLTLLAASPYSFVRDAVAHSPRADAATLAAIPLADLNRWTRNRVLAAIARHPNANRGTLLHVLRETSAALERPGERPYAAALALATRPELAEAEVSPLMTRPNASRRMAGGLRRALATRTAAVHR